MAAPTLHICYVTLQRTVEGQAGFTHVHEITSELRRMGHRVHLLEPRYTAENPWPPLRVLAIVRVICQLICQMLFTRPDVIYIRQHILSYPATLLASWFRAKTILEVNGSPNEIGVSWPALRILKPLLVFANTLELNCATAIVTVTPELGDYVRSRVRSDKRIEVIPNGANVTHMRPIQSPNVADLGIRPGEYVVFVGSLAPWQGINVMLEAVRHPKWPRGVKLVICGRGREESTVRKAAETCEDIVYLGTIPYALVPHVVSGSLAGLAPKINVDNSTAGLSPLKVFEYLACGRPVIASDLGGLKEIVEGNNVGLVIRPGNAEDLAKAVAILAGDPQMVKAMGSRARAYAVSNLSWSARASQTEGLIRTVIDPSVRTPHR